MKKVIVIGAIIALAGCTSSAERMYQCESQGVSRDACYVAEQNRKANINGTAEKQALENAAGVKFGSDNTNDARQAKRGHHRKHRDTSYDEDSAYGDSDE